MPDPNNPLSYIGQSNDPSLTQRTVDTNRSLQEMRRNLGQIASESGYARQLEAQKGWQERNLEELKARRAVEKLLYEKNINPSNWGTAMQNLGDLYQTGQEETGTNIVVKAREAGLFQEHPLGISLSDFVTDRDRPMFTAAPVPGAGTGDVITLTSDTGQTSRRTGQRPATEEERKQGFTLIDVYEEDTSGKGTKEKSALGTTNNELAWASEPTKKFRVADSGIINTVRNAVRNVGENQKFANEVYEDKTHYYIFNHTDNKNYNAPKSGMPGMGQVE
jgi:hypothetical protein